MKRRLTTSRQPAKTRHSSAAKLKRNSAPTATRPGRSTVADLQEQVGALTRELAEARKQLVDALEQQTAASEVLKIISSSRTELQPVFGAILDNATRICGAKFGTLYLRDGNGVRAAAMHNAPPAYAKVRMQGPIRCGGGDAIPIFQVFRATAVAAPALF